MQNKPQAEQKHPDDWTGDLRADRMKGQNIGQPPRGREADARTAYDVKRVHRALDELNANEVKQIPVLEPGTRLRQGATYLDLDRGQLTATGDMSVAPGEDIVAKDRVPYEIWKKLIGEEKR